MPLPLSEISIVFELINLISTLSAYPATTSSMELSKTSLTRWCKAAVSVPPIYIPGRFLTGSSPSKTSISFAV